MFIFKRKHVFRATIVGLSMILCVLLAFVLLMNSRVNQQNTYDQATQAGPITTYMTQYAPQPDCNVCMHEGWSKPIPSPNGKYIYETKSTHYGQRSFVVLTTDYTRQVFYRDSGMPYSMVPGGCDAYGWQSDGHLLFSCNDDPSARDRLDPDTGKVDLYCTGKSPEFTSSAASWAPDGQRIALIAQSGYSPSTLYSVKSDGSQLHWLGEVDHDSTIDWSPDGKRIVYMTSDQKIVVVNNDGSEQRELIAGDNPRWSPDGKQIAFTRRSEGSLYTIDSDGGNLKLLASASVASFAWSPDGNYIAVASAVNTNRPSEIHIFDIRSQAKPSTMISNQFYVNGGLAWSPDSRQIAFVAPPARYGSPAVFVINIDGSDPRKIADNTLNEPPSWGPGGKNLFFAHSIGGEGMISVEDLENGAERDLYSVILWHLTVSPDGHSVAFTGNDFQTYVGDVDGHEWVNLTQRLASQFDHPCNKP